MSPYDGSHQRQVSDFNCLGDALELEAVEGDDEAAAEADQEGCQVEGVRVILDAGVQVHAEDAAAASRESDAQSQDFHVEVHLNDVVPRFVLRQKVV